MIQQIESKNNLKVNLEIVLTFGHIKIFVKNGIFEIEIFLSW